MKKRLIRFEHLKVGLVNLGDSAVESMMDYRNRWREIEALRIAQNFGGSSGALRRHVGRRARVSLPGLPWRLWSVGFCGPGDIRFSTHRIRRGSAASASRLGRGDGPRRDRRGDQQVKSRRMASVENQALSFPTASQTSGAVDLGDGPIRRRRALDGRSVQRLMPSLLPSLQTRHGSLFGSDNEMDARTIS